MYYAKRIFEEEGTEAGIKALQSVDAFAKHVGRKSLESKAKELLEDLSNDNDIWWPSENDYNPALSKEDWLSLLRREDVVGPIWGDILAMFYDYGGAATCTQLGQRYKKNPSSIRSCATQLARKIHEITDCPLYISDGKEKYWTILFQGQKASEAEEGSWVWKLRTELYDALTEFDILRFLSSSGENEVPMDPGNTISVIKNYISSKGFTYEDGLIENFYLSLKSKPFVILAGISGTGKTKLVKLFAEAISAQYKMVAVRPDWSDSTDLFGHVDLNGNFIPGAVLDFIYECKNDPKTPYILCLDEMNLARVEYYLSDFLSIIETREKVEDSIISDPLVSIDQYGVDEEARKKYGIIQFPQNLYLVGTVNMDETTFPFSKKVLDRANTIEFNSVKLDSEENGSEASEALTLDNEFLKTNYLLLAHTSQDKEYVAGICKELQEINEILQSANAHVGYRVRDEIVFYMLNNKQSDLLDEDAAMDNEIMQKILPRIQGSSSNVKAMLCELFIYLTEDSEGLQIQNNDTASEMKKRLSEKTVRYPKSAEKVAFMVGRFEEDGFTSYWL